ncbi:forkhead-associated protein [Methylococcaceae bacterium CS1]|nr:forkhead-associated protein [Methylococcaceae bacterium CS4]TXK98464.1 forkhead-associated protein [Methylococcaceae bacterium CS5]TXL04203.1 forkhead-associated protein [Methylococcaceae bacterium CS3]TXL07323.1 forkhead-associated protein [Methylococcaceae bacterium CS1]TXL11144.1 forkhead-associated protein [Methylococcaceae bacterium CS2]TXL22390.1 forkhead-associated protein [Methylococcaceae bacterium HT2]
MAKFTVFYKDNLLSSTRFESGVVHIGRDETNALSIDSLAFAPAHAAVILHNSESIIKQLNADFPLIINGQRHSKHLLKNGDTITIGKHRIIYNHAEPSSLIQQHIPKQAPENQKNQLTLPEANLQIMAGKHIGHIVSLKKNMTRIGNESAGIIIVTRRKDGYFASVLKPDDRIKINDRALTDKSQLLKNSDTILINNTPMQFSYTKTS